MNFKKYKHVIWDWNGTIFNDVKLCCDIMNVLLSRRDIKKISIEEYKNVFTFPVKEYYKIVGHDISDANWEIISHEFMDEYEKNKKHYRLYENAEKVIAHFSQLKITQSVLSAYSQNTLDELIQHFHLRNYFIRLIGLDNIYAEGKLDNGLKWMKELGHKSGEVLLIGDTVHDFEVAKEIGADCLLISDGHQSKEKLLKFTKNVVDSLGDILKDI
ncbi:HAD family hydrolase [Bacteroidota bacterium]